jgi:hypothetical protein
LQYSWRRKNSIDPDNGGGQSRSAEPFSSGIALADQPDSLRSLSLVEQAPFEPFAANSALERSRPLP